MSETHIALLPNRGSVRLTGPDAGTLLQGIVTNDLDELAEKPAIFAGLLSPQGKILFAFFVIRIKDGYLLETSRCKTTELIQRLKMYKLRADANICDVSEEYTVAVCWSSDKTVQATSQTVAHLGDAIAFTDPRLPELGIRMLVSLTSDWVPGETGATPAPHEDYDAHRISLGIPEIGKDYQYGEAYPHEALFDQLAGVSFTKGCYIGQEVVSRMQHKATIRKRVVPVTATQPLPLPDTPVTAGESTIGKLGSTHKTSGLALLRLDRAADAEAKGATLSADNIKLQIALPAWAGFSMPDAKIPNES